MNKKLSFFSLAFVSLFAVSCSGEAKDNVPLKTAVWSTYATAKVIQQANKNTKYTNLGKNISISMMQNEKETGQLIVTSNKKAKVKLEYGTLTNEKGDVISSNDVSIYYQKYLKVDINKHGGDFFDNGDIIPDFLLPMDKAIEYKENFVYDNSNQGFTVEINSKTLSAGTYKGNFVLTIDDTKQDIPVEVTVWDFGYHGKSKIQSCWLTYTSDLFGTEYDCSPEIAEKYMEFTTDYKACPYLIQEAIENQPVPFCDQMERLFQNENYNTIIIPYDFQLDYVYGTDQEKPARFIEEIARRSTEENFYLDYAVFYPSTYDEADADRTRPKAEAVPHFFEEGGEYQKTLEGAYNNLKTSGYFSDKSEEWEERVKNAILNIPAIFTNVGFITDWVENYPAVYCPYQSLLSNTKFREIYIDTSDRVNGKYWTYTCTDPDYPYPSHHLDDDNLSMRVLGWMEKAYNISGYLYYETCLFPGHNPGIYHDQYKTGERYIGCNGDGFILYPGHYYGSDTPFPSSRLVTYRDGLEDYDMLCIYEDLLKTNAEKFGIKDFDASKYVNDLYDSLFYNAVNYTDHSLLVKARNELARRITELKSNDKVFFMEEYDNVNNKQIVKAYSSSSMLINEQGATIYGTKEDKGYVYTFEVNGKQTINLFDFDINCYSYKVENVRKITSYSVSGLSNVTKTDENVILSTNDNYFEAKIVSAYKDVNEDGQPYVGRNTRKYYPDFEFSFDQIGNARYLEFEYENIGDVTIDLSVNVTRGTSTSNMFSYDHSCAVNKKKKLIIDLSKATMDVSSYNKIIIRFTNYGINDTNEVLIKDRTIRIGNIYLRGER